MHGRRSPRGAAFLASAILVISAAVVPTPAAATASSCPSASVGGKAVGYVGVGKLRVPIKNVRMARDRIMDGAASNRVASLVTNWRPLSAKKGTTVLLWHSRFGKGCEGTLNVLFRTPPGGTFTVTDAKGKAHRYKIRAIAIVPKGKYQRPWFAYNGPRQMTLVTCTGLVRNTFTKNYIITAVPV